MSPAGATVLRVVLLSDVGQVVNAIDIAPIPAGRYFDVGQRILDYFDLRVVIVNGARSGVVVGHGNGNYTSKSDVFHY